MDKSKKQNVKYLPQEIEPKWQKKWEESKIYSPDLDKAKKPFLNLMMFPYPSAEGMHVGNMYAFTGSDIYGRFKKLQGFDVFEPIGLDGFGIHSENYAIKVGRHPKEQAKISQENFYRQLRDTGNSYDWTRTVETYDQEYYKWTQWIFIQLYKAGLAYRKKSPVNFCPSCKTVLADEQVIDGACERCGTQVEKRDLEQWFFKITKYADRLLAGLDHIDWSEKVKIAQRNWIGRSEGALIEFKIQNSCLAARWAKFKIKVFTTRPDTLFGATYLVLAPEYEFVNELVTNENKAEVNKYIKIARSKSDQERIAEGKEKTGVFTGSYAINPVNNEKIPVWVADYVIGTYGTGAIMAVPAHDERDFEFAKKYSLLIKKVIVPKPLISIVRNVEDIAAGASTELRVESECWTEKGDLVNSGQFTGMDSEKAKWEITKFTGGEKRAQYHLRDWLISRQRYWGPPIPIIYCSKCWEFKVQSAKFKVEGKDYIVVDGKEYAIIPVPENDLPVLLPDVKDWRPEGTGKSPLANHPEFYETTCPVCGSKARRETDVSDTFLDSSWYLYRYISTEIKDKAFDPQRVKKWLPVNMYIGGAEHSVLHLLYTRFLAMVFKDLGLIDFEEPFTKFRAHGLIIAEGAKMSKSKGNVVNPDKYIKEYGADTLRMYLMFMGPFKDGGDFRDSAIGGLYRFLNRVWQLQNFISNNDTDREEKVIVHKTIKKVTDDIENLRYNTAIASLMELVNFIYRKGKASKETVKTLLVMLSPFAPHITEELYQNVILRSETTKDLDSSPSAQNDKVFKSIHRQSWPSFDPGLLVEKEVTIVVQVNGKVRDTVKVQKSNIKDQKWIEEEAKKSERVKKHLEGKSVKKVIYVEGKIINFVTSG
ncbi:MAG: leucine--tRNA ligase [Candidatus Levybacteria bacterium]|nr:leucine--tRNA ligase [Candidatus Levybacteria bacterium]